MEWANDVKVKIDGRMSQFTYKLYTNKHMGYLSSPDVKTALDNMYIYIYIYIYKDLVVVLIDKTTGNIGLAFKTFYASFISRELGLNNNSSTDTYKYLLVAYLQII